jgi:hypothetical protein
MQGGGNGFSTSHFGGTLLARLEFLTVLTFVGGSIHIFGLFYTLLSLSYHAKI